jgi:CrcB protein
VSATPSRSLRGDLGDLALVAAGAIPGALLRWRLEAIGTAEVGGLRGLVGADFVANMLGCLLLGLVLAQSERRQRLILWAGIGFCGSLTTFSSWMLQLAHALRAGQAWNSLLVLVASLLGGLVLVALGHLLGRRCQPTAPASSSKGASPQLS